jgi:nitrate reductase beta subunit
MRKREVLGEHDAAMPEAVGMSVDDIEDMYRLLAIADYNDRYVIPQAHAELGNRLMEQQGACGLDFEGGPGNCGMVVPESEADTEGFMLEQDQEAQLDLVKMAGGRRRNGGEGG